MRIATAGKGGVGKTTITALLVRYLIEKNKKPVLAIDADPNSNLCYYLGAKYQNSISDIRDDLKSDKLPAGFSKTDFLELKINEVISENKDFDLLVMGKPEGPGCYCFVNELLRTSLSKLSAKYVSTIIDNEAGLEHLSRRTTDNIDELFIVSTPEHVSLRTALHIKETAKKLKLKINEISLILNRVQNSEQVNFSQKILGENLKIKTIVPETVELYNLFEKNIFDIVWKFDFNYI